MLCCWKLLHTRDASEPLNRMLLCCNSDRRRKLLNAGFDQQLPAARPALAIGRHGGALASPQTPCRWGRAHWPSPAAAAAEFGLPRLTPKWSGGIPSGVSRRDTDCDLVPATLQAATVAFLAASASRPRPPAGHTPTGLNVSSSVGTGGTGGGTIVLRVFSTDGQTIGARRYQAPPGSWLLDLLIFGREATTAR